MIAYWSKEVELMTNSSYLHNLLFFINQNYRNSRYYLCCTFLCIIKFSGSFKTLSLSCINQPITVLPFKAIKAATLAWWKVSLRLRVKAEINTFFLVLHWERNIIFFSKIDVKKKKQLLTFSLRCFAIFPRQIVVFVLIPGSGSIWSFAKYFNKS